jgi:hypothetical protein
MAQPAACLNPTIENEPSVLVASGLADSSVFDQKERIGTITLAVQDLSRDVHPLFQEIAGAREVSGGEPLKNPEPSQAVGSLSNSHIPSSRSGSDLTTTNGLCQTLLAVIDLM